MKDPYHNIIKNPLASKGEAMTYRTRRHGGHSYRRRVWAPRRWPRTASHPAHNRSLTRMAKRFKVSKISKKRMRKRPRGGNPFRIEKYAWESWAMASANSGRLLDFKITPMSKSWR